MYYWNKANFDGLNRLSEELDLDPNLRLLASYCRFREQGLRRDAMSALERFLVASSTFDSPTARSSAIKILEANERTREAHQFLTQPLVTRFLLPTLRTWLDEVPGDNMPVRWLGMLCRDHDLLSKALAMCPEDSPVRKLMVERDLSHAWHATHHLNESFFIGDIAETFAVLDHASGLIASAPNPQQLGYLASELEYFDNLVTDWRAYSAGGEAESFPEWCAVQGREYSFPTKVYYKR